jgi:hypothetical protein
LPDLSEVGRSRCYVPGKNGKDLAAEALQALEATSLYLFGSVVRDEAKAASDLDLFIDYDRDGRGAPAIRKVPRFLEWKPWSTGGSGRRGKAPASFGMNTKNAVNVMTMRQPESRGFLPGCSVIRLSRRCFTV